MTEERTIRTAIVGVIDRWSTKWASGRFLWTVAGVVVFIWGAVSGAFDSDDLLKVIMLIVGFYFGQSTKTNGNGGK